MPASTLPAPAAAPSPPARQTASEAAAANTRANLRALSQTQPRLASAVTAEPVGAWPVYARDGSLTVVGPDGKWWHGCSVPRAAAEAMLSSLELKGRIACLLAPTLAAHVRVPLRQLAPNQGVVAVCLDLLDLGIMLACEDFSGAIQSHRLWFTWGEDWAGELAQLFAERPGLATPAQFIRLPVTPAEQVERLVPAAQAVFAEVNTQRVASMARRRDAWRPTTRSTPRLCVVAPSQFRLWNDAGLVLAERLGEAAAAGDVVSLDPDDPASSSSLALLDAAASCSAIVAADTFRADLPGVAPDAMPWITWVTRPGKIPPFDGARAHDTVVITHPDWRMYAITSGWPPERIREGGWPTATAPTASRAAGPNALAVVADTRPVVMPTGLEEFSSHLLLWNDISGELTTHPLSLGNNAVEYLERHMNRRGVAADGFDAAAFIDALIVPAYAQGLVRTLLAAGLPVRLFGAGWDRIDEFRHVAFGPMTSQDDLARVRDHAAAVVDVSVLAGAHPLQRLGIPILTTLGATRQRFIDEALRALAGRARPEPAAGAPLSRNLILSLLQE